MRKLLIGYLIIHFAVIIYIHYRWHYSTEKTVEIATSDGIEYISFSPNYSYHKFEDPEIALKLLDMIDPFEPVPESVYKNNLFNHSRYGREFQKMKHNPNYCENVRKNMVQNPKYMFQKPRYFTDYGIKEIPRLLIQKTGIDVFPKYTRYNFNKRNKTVAPPWNVQMFWTFEKYHPFNHIGKDIACPNQMYCHLPGNMHLNRKDLIVETLKEYDKFYENKRECFDMNDFFPQTWILKDKDQCDDFFRRINSQEFVELKKKYRILYIRKKGMGFHEGRDVETFHESEEYRIRYRYKNGTLCGIDQSDFIMQKYIHNPLLLYGHKFDFRMYMLIASTNPHMLYFHDGFLRVALQKYDLNSGQKGTFLTNSHLAYFILQRASRGEKFDGMGLKELIKFQVWSLERFKNYLLKVGKINDPNWLENYFFPSLKKAYLHIWRAGYKPFLVRSQLFQLMALDFMMDDDLKIWFIEANSSPLIRSTNRMKYNFLFKMLRDILEIEIGLVRSRMKRMVNYINKITIEIMQRGVPGILETDRELFQPEYKKLIKNYFEPEFKPKFSNTFSPIMNSNLKGKDRYFGLIDEKCLGLEVDEM